MLDHLVYAVPDLDEGVAELSRLTGVRPTPGGRHKGFGTHNALLALTDRTYVEIIAPDPDAPELRRPRPFGLDGLAEPRMAGWVFRTTDLAGVITRALSVGFDLGAATEMARQRPDGTTLSWQLTSALPRDLRPAFIDWGDSTHPTDALEPSGLSLQSLTVQHPAGALRRGPALPGHPAPGGGRRLPPPAPRLVAQFTGPGGGLILD